ncbi:MAG: hypothetical protein JWL68_2662 [Actinomycetia bacterium]|nr:hypothetical protein [Actinomycetes bacterium]
MSLIQATQGPFYGREIVRRRKHLQAPVVRLNQYNAHFHVYAKFLAVHPVPWLCC